MARSIRYSNLPCDHCGRPHTDHDRGPALWITDARPLDFGGIIGVIEANPGEPKLCDDCELAWRERGK